jgi:hypothetical protein
MSQRIYKTYLKKELQFLTDAIHHFRRFMFIMPAGYFSGHLDSMLGLKFDDKAEQTNVIKLDAFGFMILMYTKAFKEQFPKEPLTQEQKDKIDALWNALAYPEYVGKYTQQDVYSVSNTNGQVGS